LDITAPLQSPGTPQQLGRSAAIRAASHRALAARNLIRAGSPHWEPWRWQARAIKLEAINRLDDLLRDLERSVTAWGGQVLWARDAAQARELILAVAREHEVATVVKSKSMTTEEIGLNPALSAAGLQVLETDLGEFIIQLAGHPPAHLTAPALHLDRHQIAEIFATHLGFEVAPEPQALTRRATAYIAPHFFEAHMGITGVNFAAPDGTLVLLENESNLRFTATLPKVHLAVMGLEKMIPRLKDVEVMLRLLPASATGQRLTALVHFIRGLKPRHQGSQAFYLVILDNGRRRLAREPAMAEALGCVRCGACLNVCPIFQVGAAHLYGRVYPGAIGILLAPYLAPAGDIADLCAQCGACQEICPVGIRLTELIHGLRQRSKNYRLLQGATKTAGAVLSQPRWYRGLEPAWRKLANLATRRSWGRGIPEFAPQSFHHQEQGRRVGLAAEVIDQARAMPAVATPFPGIKRVQELHEAPESGAANGLLAQRLTEAAATLLRVEGPAALARHLAAAAAPLWLADHPWLRQAAAELDRLGIEYHLAIDAWAPEAGTAVTVGLGAIPETGSVLVDSGAGPAAVLAFRARQHIILVPRERSNLSLAQALEYVKARGAGMISWLTGPSRTADIEKVLVLGAQGPEQLEVILYQEDA
jgi:L-lactate dehydrogenase complex protein LldF